MKLLKTIFSIMDKEKKSITFILSSVIGFTGMATFIYDSQDVGMFMLLIAIWVSVVSRD